MNRYGSAEKQIDFLNFKVAIITDNRANIYVYKQNRTHIQNQEKISEKKNKTNVYSNITMFRVVYSSSLLCPSMPSETRQKKEEVICDSNAS